jgi:hypothetical protein
MRHLHLIKFSSGSSKCFIAFLDVAARQSKVALCRWLKNHNALSLCRVNPSEIERMLAWFLMSAIFSWLRIFCCGFGIFLSPSRY